MAAYQDCPRLRYLTYHFADKGLQRKAASLPLINGDFIHKALASLVQGQDLDDVLDLLIADYKNQVVERSLHNEHDHDFVIQEQLCLLEGLVRAWARIRLPHILADYDVIDVEREVEWKLADGITVMLRMDLVLRRKSDRLLFIKDYKTVGAMFDDWAIKFQHDSQLLCYTGAAEAIYNEPIGGLLMEALIKGRRAIDKSTTSPFSGQKIQQSPLCYGYKVRSKASGLPVFEQTWSRGAEKVPVWELPSGIKGWIDDMADIDLNELFVVLPAIRPTRTDMERWQAQMVYQENRIQLNMALIKGLHETYLETGDDDDYNVYLDALDEYFPQNRNHCYRYTTGHPCGMLSACDAEEILLDPIGSGFYQARVPHHAPEDE